MSENNLSMHTIALAGNPNSGKTTIFNALTGARQHVGNYSGVTVEEKYATLHYGNSSYKIIDLPGTYSLSHHSPEERVAEEVLLSGTVDRIVAILDSTTLNRSLVFVTQLLQLGLPVIVCLNMADEARKSGQKIDTDLMSQLMGCRVIETVAAKGEGIEELKRAIDADWDKPSKSPTPRLRLGDALDTALTEIIEALPDKENYPHWIATKLILNEKSTTERLQNSGNARSLIAIQKAKSQREHIEKLFNRDIQIHMTESYYGYVDGLLKETLISRSRPDARKVSDAIDNIVVHKWLGLPIFLAIVYALFWLTFELGAYPMEWINMGTEALKNAITAVWPTDTWSALRSLIIDGIIGGVGGVIIFLPNIVILFLGIAFLEDTGYMARSAFLMDKLMHRVGLHGRSFIPLISGFGCSIPGIMATRTIAGEKERLTTMFILPLMSCGARLPIWLLLVPAFFAESWRAPVMMGIYLFGVIAALILAFVLRKSLFKGEEEPFVMELPPYRMPTLRAVLTHMFERSWLYLKKAGTIILAVSIVLWFLMSYPKMSDAEMETIENRAQIAYQTQLANAQETQKTTQETNTIEAATQNTEENAEQQDPQQAFIDNAIADAEMQHSIAGRMGKALATVFQPMGFDWRIGTAMIGAIAAKEVFVAQMGIVYSLGEVDEENDNLRENIARDYPKKTGIALIIFLLISAPCMATVAVMKRESASWKWALLQFFGLTLIAYILAVIAYQGMSLFS